MRGLRPLISLGVHGVATAFHPTARGFVSLHLHRLPSRVNGRVGRPHKGARNGSLSCLTAVAARSAFILIESAESV
jgi:hypothetical protein